MTTPVCATEMAVHGLRNPESGAMTLVAFPGRTEPKSPERCWQVAAVAEAARTFGDVIEELKPDDIGIETGVRLYAAVHRNPGLEAVLLPVTRPF